MADSDNKSGASPLSQPGGSARPIPVFIPIIAFLFLATIVSIVWLWLGRPAQTSAPAPFVPEFRVGAASIHMNHFPLTTKVYINADFSSNRDDATITTYESFTIRRTEAAVPDRDTLNGVHTWVAKRAAAGTGGSTYQVRRGETKVLYIDGPLIKNAQLHNFTSGKYTYYFEMLVLANDGHERRQLDICGYSPGNGIVYSCPP
jgi:hypothetical protein